MASDHDDDALLGELRRLARNADPVPETVLIAARAAIESRDLESRLAALLADSWAAGSDASAQPVRGGGPETTSGRMLTYAAAGVRIDLGVEPEAGSLTLIGQLAGASTEGCVLQRPDGTATPVESDDLGRFLITVGPGVVRLRCRSLTGSRVVTPWLTL
jgi:hypothetical protein